MIVPHGILYDIPFSALYDGKQFLIERYVIAVIPGLELVDLVPFKRDRIRILLAGISESVKGFPPLAFPILPYVAEELRNIQNIHNILEDDVLLDEKFTISNVRARMKNTPYSIVHFSTYGQFRSTPNKSYLLSYDDKITMDNLSNVLNINRFTRKPIDLIVFSASETAQGDELAALGLAGVVVKAGARSALGSLWNITDKESALLMTEFYRQLKINPNFSKAKALQRAQLKLLKSEKYNNPYFWAPYILVGNWL